MGYPKKGKKDQQNGKEGVQILRMMPTNVAHIFVLVGVCSMVERDFGASSTWTILGLVKDQVLQGVN
jgi:hypothetical protein